MDFPRTCRICKEEKPQWEYWHCKAYKDGWHTACAECLKYQKKHPKLESPKSQIIVKGHKPCRRCGKTKALSAFHRDQTAKSGYRSSCKFCCPRVYDRKTVSVIPLRVAVISYMNRTGENWSDIGRRTGVKGANSSWMQRRLGIIPNTGQRSSGKPVTRTHERIAAQILDAIGKAPHEIGL